MRALKIHIKKIYPAALGAFFFCLPLCACVSAKSKSVVEIVEAPPEDKVEPLYSDGNMAGVSFIPEAAPEIAVPDDVGSISGMDSGAARALGQEAWLRAIFRRAYAEALLQNIPLAGVLGMDRLHRWPENTGLTWVQNWRSSVYTFNSWGIPNLVMAILNTEGTEVFTVSGAILDYYGQSQGIGGANGVEGYGSPLSSVFFLNQGPDAGLSVAQRFEKGLIYLNNRGKGFFIPEEAPSRRLTLDENAGFFQTQDDELREKLKEAFKNAYIRLVDRTGEAPPSDGSVEFISLGTERWLIGGDSFEGGVNGFYVQFFGKLSAALVLPAGEGGAPAENYSARILSAPFLEILLQKIRLPAALGMELYPLPQDAGKTAAGALLASFALYGIPFSDLFVLEEKGLIFQRFSKGLFEGTITLIP
jgi:hypothetical protein